MMRLLAYIAHRLGKEELFDAHKHHVPRIGKVLAVGGVGFVIQTFIFETFAIWLGLIAASTATLLGAELAIISNFTLNERFSFRGDFDRSVPWWRRIGKFHLVSMSSLVVQWMCVRAAEHLSASPLALNVAFIIGVGIGFITNYAGYYIFVWRRA